MNRRQLTELIENGESLTCEFKRKFTTQEKIAREIIAFANTKGGVILFGVDDDKQIIGVESEKEIAELVKDTTENYIEPPKAYTLQYIDMQGKEVVVLKVSESDNKPHRLQDYLKEFDILKAVVCIRVNDKSVQASKEMVRIMRAAAQQKELKKYALGPNEKTVFDFLNKNERISVRELSSLVNISERRASRTLVKLVRANLLMIHTKDNGEEYFTNSM